MLGHDERDLISWYVSDSQLISLLSAGCLITLQLTELRKQLTMIFFSATTVMFVVKKENIWPIFGIYGIS